MRFRRERTATVGETPSFAEHYTNILFYNNPFMEQERPKKGDNKKSRLIETDIENLLVISSGMIINVKLNRLLF